MRPTKTQFHDAERRQVLPECFVAPRNVFERLTDHKFYTGTHKARFDEFGNGRGLAGRDDVFLFDGMTESPSRTHEVYSSVIRKPRRPVVEPHTLGVQRFGVQAITPRLIWLFRNGDLYHDGSPLFLKAHIKNLSQLSFAASSVTKPIMGPVRKFYDQALCEVTHLEDLVDGGKYLVTSGEPPAPCARLQKFLSPFVVQR